jgi:predicted short-subunit dehydrogenase-like oxidoreductase (DUF2520 family)
MFSHVAVIGRGRAGSAIAARLGERGVLAAPGVAPDLSLVCVPDGAIAEVARSIPPGAWVAHVSGATPLAALDPHTRRFGVHPLQTLTRSRGPEQLDGAWAAVTGADADARGHGEWLARTLGLRPFVIEEDQRVLYHAGAAMASNFLVTLFRAAARAVERAGAPPEALVPLMRRTIDNEFELTGPISRGDWDTVRAHLAALERELPDLAPLYRVLTDATSR